MNKKLILLGGFLAVIVLGFSLALYAPAQRANATSPTATLLGTATTSAGFSITVSQRILATTTSVLGGGHTRVYTSICNPNANPVYLNLNGDAPAGTSTATTVISAAAGYSACYEITDRNLYQGSVTASSTNQTATNIFVSDYVQ